MKYILFLSTMSMLFVACIKKECKNIPGGYEFEIPATLSPAKDTFQVGDTITITSIFPDEVYERKTDKWYKLENFRFFPGTEVQKIDTLSAIDGLALFEMLVDSSTNYGIKIFSGGEMRLKGEYAYEGNQYSLAFRLVAKNPGLYYMEQTVFPPLDTDQGFDGKCSNKGVDAAVVLNGGADNNIHLLSDSPDPHYNDWILQDPTWRFHRFGGYCFYVK